jgi:hypothetical protein
MQILSRFGPQLPAIIDTLTEKLNHSVIEKPYSNKTKLFWCGVGSLLTILLALIVYSI